MPGLLRQQAGGGSGSTFSHRTLLLPSRYRVDGVELQVSAGQPNVGSRIQVLWEWYVWYNNGERVEVFRHRWFNAVIIGPAFAINGSGEEELMKDSYGNQVWGLQYERDDAFGDQQRNRLVVFPCQGVVEDYHDGESYDWRFISDDTNPPRRQNATHFPTLVSHPVSVGNHADRIFYGYDEMGCESCDEEDEEEDDEEEEEEEEEEEIEDDGDYHDHEDDGGPMSIVSSEDEEDGLEETYQINDEELQQIRQGGRETDEFEEIGMLARRVGFVVDSNLLNSALYGFTTNEGLCREAIDLMQEQNQESISPQELAPVMRQFRCFAYQKIQELINNQNVTVLNRQMLRQILSDFRVRGQH